MLTIAGFWRRGGGWEYIPFFSEVSRLALGFMQPPVKISTGPFPLRLKRPECEAVQLHLSNTEDKKMWSHVSPFQYAFMVCAGTNLPYFYIL
jgi:hypothetical protein